MTLCFNELTYVADVNRTKLNKLIGFDINELSPDNESWREQYSDIYGYGLNNNKREVLFNQLVQIIQRDEITD